MPLYSDDGYPEGTVRSIDPGYDPNKSFVQDPYKKRRPTTASGGFDGLQRPRRRENTASQRGHSPPASVQSGRTGSTARQPPPKPPQSRHSRMGTNIQDFSAHDDDEQSMRSYSTARKGSFPVDATEPARRQESSVYSQEPVQPPPRRKTMSEFSAYKRTQPDYGNNPHPYDPFGLPMNMGGLSLEDRSDHSAALSTRHGQERGLVSQNGFQDRMPLPNSTQQSLQSTRDQDYAEQAYEFKQAIKDEIRSLTTASDRYIDPKDAIKARGAQVIAEERFTAKMMGPEAYKRATYGAPEIDLSQRPAPRPGLASASALSNYGNQYYQPRLVAPREPGFIEAGSVRDEDFSAGYHGTSSHRSRRESVSYNDASLPPRAIMPSAERFRDPRNDRFDEPPPPRTRPPPSHTGSYQSVKTRSDYSKHDSRAGRSRRSSRREEQDEYDRH